MNIYCDNDCEALTDVIMDYFTIEHSSDTEDDEQCNDSDNEVGLTKCVSVDSISVDCCIFLNINIKLLFNSVSVQDISVFDNIAEIFPRLPDPENGPAPVATENFHCGCR